MKKLTALLGFASLFSSSVVMAHNVQLNSNLPQVMVANEGELVLNGKEIDFKDWNSASLAGKVRVVYHLAGRSAVKERDQNFVAALKAAHFDRSKYQTTTIINADDAILGTGVFVKNSAKAGKRDNPHSQLVLDQKSTVKKAWQLRDKDSFVAVLDKNGKVQFIVEGKLSPEQIKQVVELVNGLIKQ